VRQVCFISASNLQHVWKWLSHEACSDHLGEIRETALEIVGSIFEALVTVIIANKVMYTEWIMGTEVLVYVRISAT